MNEELQAAVDYVRHHLQQGVPETSLRQALQSQGWDQGLIDQVFMAAWGSPAPAPPLQQPVGTVRSTHTVRSAVLWILSPIIVLFGTFLLSLLIRLAGVESSAVTNIPILLAGIVGILLVFIGPVVGIVKLARRR